MNTTPAVIVNKSGFLSSVAKGVFGTVMVAVVCASAIGLYGLRVFDRQASTLSHQVFAALPDWQHSLPPAIADALNDHRDPEYRREVEVTARLVSGGDDRWERTVVVEATNRGSETISLLAVRLVLEDEKQVPRGETALYVATPLVIEKSWYGPIMPGSTPRRVATKIHTGYESGKVTVEITDLRVANKAELTPLPPPMLQPPEPPGGPEDAERDEPPAPARPPVERTRP